MESQFYAGRAGALQTRWGEPVRIDHRGGEFVVRSGRVWITRPGDLDDHIIGAGQRIMLEPADGVVVEQWHRDQPAVIDWRPRHAAPRQLRRVTGLARGVAARVLCGVAFAAGASARGLRRVEGGFAALARSAAAMARRAQGCICAGDSIASAGTVQ